jgi:hypothetical protein
MTESDRHALQALTAAGYFDYAADQSPGEAIIETIERNGLHAALFDYAHATGRAVQLDAEDLAEGGAGMGIQQVQALLALRGLACEAADSDAYDDAAGLTTLTINGKPEILCNLSFGKQPIAEEIEHLPFEPALRALMWKCRAQGLELQVMPCRQHGSSGNDLHLSLGGETRFLNHWHFDFDHGRALYAINFFGIVNRFLVGTEFPERLYASRPFTNEQAGILLTPALFSLLQQLGLADQLRRIDAVPS